MKAFSRISLFVLACALVMVGCQEDEPLINKAEDNLFNIQGATVNALNISGSEFDIADLDKTPITFDMTSTGEEVSSVNMYISLNGGPRMLVSNIASLPSMQSLNITEAAAAAGVSEESLVPGDIFTVTFDEITTNSGVFPSGVSFEVLVVTIFKSALAGVMNCVTTVTSQSAGIGWDNCADATWEGTVEWVRNHTDPNADGNYTILSTAESGEEFEDMSHGAYYACYGTDAQANLPNGDLVLTDVDGVLAIPGASQWGEVFSINEVSVDGATLTLAWTNDYGEGARSVITRTDGENWPENLSN